MNIQFNSIKIQLYNNLAFKWSVQENCCVRGYAYADDVLLCGETFLEYMRACVSTEEAVAKLQQLNGFYNIILQVGGEVLVCVDPISSMPMFYSNASTPLICDGIQEDLIQGQTLDADALAIFRHALFTPEQQTLLTDYHRICAGCCLLINSEGVQQIRYFSQQYASKQISDLPTAISLLDEAYTKSFHRVVQILDGRTAVVPLSGGHDSRLVAYYLKRLGYKNIIAYSYGARGNQESTISKQVADVLEIPWHFVEYDPAGMRKLMKKDYRDFAIMSGNCSSVPCLQEWYAVWQLKQQGTLDENCVIIPGYSGDFFAGSHLISDISQMHPITTEKLKTAIQTRHFGERPFCQLTAQSRLDTLFEKELPLLAQKDRVFTEDEANLLYEQFDWKNRQGKFIENAVRVYDYWGFTWLTPFFERTQFDCWSRIHNDLRYERRAFFALEDSIYPPELKTIPFAGYASGKKKSRLLRRLQLIVHGPILLHPMYGYYHTGVASRWDLCKRRLRNVNMYAQDLYLDILDQYWSSVENEKIRTKH